MRKVTMLLILMTALILVAAPGVRAANTTADSIEVNHSQYGMDLWIDSYDDNALLPGVQVEGDGAYGYYTGLNPGFNGVGLGLITMTETALPLGAPTYTTPCPDFVLLDTTRADSVEDCEANTNSDDPQTEPSSMEWEIPILDDMLAKMWDFAAENDRLTQTLDILFYLDPARKSTLIAGEENAFIDQTLDQDLADYQGNIDSYVASNGVGIVNRLVQVFGLSNSVTKADAPDLSDNTGDDADYIDQWVLSYTKDIDGTATQKVGIVSSYSSWFSLDKNVPITCPAGACGYTYAMGHDPVTKTVPEVDGHPNDDVPDP